MDLSPIQHNSIQKTEGSFAKRQSTQIEPLPQNEVPYEKLSAVDAGLLRAYVGLEVKNVSTDAIYEYLRDMGVRNNKTYSMAAAAVTDKDGVITQQSFAFFKSFFEKTRNVFLVTSFFNKAKVDGEINYKALKAMDLLVEKDDSKWGSSTDYSRIFGLLKDKDGNFNDEALQLFINHPKDFIEIINISMTLALRAFSCIKNNEGSFDQNALKYLDNQLSEGKKLKNLLSTVQKSKDEDGNFSLELLKENNRLSGMFNGYMLEFVKKIAASLPQNDAKARENFIEFADTFKQHPQFSDVLKFLYNFQTSEKEAQNPSSLGLGYDKESFDFIKQFDTALIYKDKALQAVLKTINKPFNEYSQEDIETVLNLVQNTYSEQEAKVITDAAMIKNGENKGKLSPDNVKKYLHIFQMTNLGYKENYVKDVGKLLSLEGNERALNFVENLLSKEFEDKSGYFVSRKKCEPELVLSLLKILCESDENGLPSRKIDDKKLEKLEKLVSENCPQGDMASWEEKWEERLLQTALFDEENSKKVLFLHISDFCKNVFAEQSGKNIIALKNTVENILRNEKDNVILAKNKNIKNRVEINYGNMLCPSVMLFDVQKGVPVSENKETFSNNVVCKISNDFLNKTSIEQQFKDIVLNGSKQEMLISQVVKKYDDNKNLLYTETLEQSPIENVFNIKKTYPDGHIEYISNAQKLPNGNEIIEKNMTSFDGTKSYYRYEDDVDGNRILDYKIVDKNGKTLLNESVTFEVLDENHFLSSRNGKSFDIKLDGKKLIVTNEQTLKKVDIDVDYFTRYNSEKLISVLKKISGEDLFAMKELDLKGFSLDNSVENAQFNNYERAITTSEDYLDLGVILHEWGHGKDVMMFDEINEKICDDENLRKIYEEERDAFRKNLSNEEMSLISYFTADEHYLGPNAIKEGIAETNTILNVYPKHQVQSVRAHYWQQYFPKTIAYLANLLN